jgi:phosphatidylserine/phosphatidylglycerophosphate/cardiolipin synthase-like enzyme
VRGNAEVVLRIDDETVAISMNREQLQASFAALVEYVGELKQDALASMGDDHTLQELHHEMEVAEDALDTLTKALRALSQPIE